ncbi:MAG: 30S ribosomal protein S16 [Chloroflexi bacterium]|nr:30S ribosomal protein S16 [Chloroflexota bacterium]
MVRIRLRRVGARNQPSYRIVAADKEAKRDGRFLEILGFYNPRTDPPTVTLKEDRVYDWLMKGAQPSDAVQKIFRMIGFYERYERFKKGESVEALMEESAAVLEKFNSNPKTSEAALKGAQKQA